MRPERKPRKPPEGVMLPATGWGPGFLKALCSHSFSGIRPSVKPEEGSQLSVGQTWSGRTVVWSFAQIPASCSEMPTVLSQTVCWTLIPSLR